ncbi:MULTISPECIES: cell division protein ZipA C-terminal FtsZ-binding domain-containing protein [unclassified Moraxella]|uniref:cell division protein ZipA C-terminal FtsZ-binding domain-containing protein n=1 Tax=unclassified Moraxella TaxID=2685852 RepID=UPI003AF46B7B
MSVTFTQLILMIMAVIAIVWGIYMISKALKAKQVVSLNTEAIEHDKDGLPILPRHQRPAVVETLKRQDEVVLDNASADVVLSADNTELLIDQQLLDSQSVITKSTHVSAPAQENPAPVATVEHDDAFSLLANATETIRPVVHAFDESQVKAETLELTSPILDTHIQAQIDQEQNNPLNNAVQNINISIFPNEQFGRIGGRDLLNLFDKYGIKFGAMNMFHRYENKDGTGLLWFSMMMITEDGILPFDLNKLPMQYLKGLVLFLSLPHPKAVQGFDSMMSIAGLLAHDLNASVYDETGELINKENAQMMREIAVDFGK